MKFDLVDLVGVGLVSVTGADELPTWASWILWGLMALSIALGIFFKVKNALKDGKITKEEFEDIAKDVTEGVSELTEKLPNGEKKDDNQ